MELQPVDVGQMEQADDVDRIPLEDVGAGDRDAALVVEEIEGAGDLALAPRETA